MSIKNNQKFRLNPVAKAVAGIILMSATSYSYALTVSSSDSITADQTEAGLIVGINSSDTNGVLNISGEGHLTVNGDVIIGADGNEQTNNGGEGQVNLSNSGQLTINGTGSEKIVIGGQGSDGTNANGNTVGNSGKDAGRGTVTLTDDAGIIVNGNFSQLTVGNQGGQGGQGGKGANGGNASGTSPGTSGVEGGNGGDGGFGGNGKFTISGGNANLGVITVGGDGGNAGQGGQGGQGGNGGRGGDATGSSSGAAGGAGGNSGIGGNGGNAGAGGVGVLTILGGEFTGSSLSVGGNGGQGGSAGDKGSVGSTGFVGQRHLKDGVSAPSAPEDPSEYNFGGAGGAGGSSLSGNGGNAADGGVGTLNISNAKLVISGHAQFGGQGGAAGNEASGAGTGAGGTPTMGSKGGQASIGFDNVEFSAGSMTFGGQGGDSASSKNGGQGGNVASLTITNSTLKTTSGDLIFGGQGGASTNSGGGGAAGTADADIVNISDSMIHSQGDLNIGGQGGEGTGTGGGGAGGTAMINFENNEVTVTSTLAVGGEKGTGIGGVGGDGQLNVKNSNVTADKVLIGQSGSGYALFKDGSVLTATNGITIDATSTESPSIGNAKLEVRGINNIIDSNIDIAFGEVQISQVGSQVTMKDHNITLNADPSTPNNANLNINGVDSWAIMKGLNIASGAVDIANNGILVVKDFDASSASNGSSLYIGANNGVAILGGDTSSWDNTGDGPNYQIDPLKWHQHQVQVAGHNPDNYHGGTLAFLGQRDSAGNVTSLDLSQLNVGVGTVAVAPGNGGIFGANSLTILNSPGYSFDPLTGVTGVSAILVDSGTNSPFVNDNAKLLLVVDNKIKVGDQINVLENSAGNFDGITSGQLGWTKDGNAFSTSRLLTVDVNANGDKLTAEFGKADIRTTMPGLSVEGANLLGDMVEQVGVVVGEQVVDGVTISSGVHFYSRASDAMYVPDARDSARIGESSFRLRALGQIYQVGKAANSQVADVVYGRVGTISPGRKGDNAPVANVVDAAGNGFSIWLTPLHYNAKYKSIKVDPIYSVGAKTQFTAGVFGIDYLYSENLIVGAEFNYGKGDVKSNGNLLKTKNDFDFFGGSLFAGYNIDNLTLIGDVSYTHTKNKLKQDIPASMLMYGLYGTTKGKIFGIGARAEYLFETESLDITPYVGMRWTQIKFDNYTVKTPTSYSPGSSGNILNVTEKKHSLFEIPLGVRFDGAYNVGNGILNPYASVGAIFLSGDRDAKTTVRVPDVDSVQIFKTPAFDRVTFDMQLGARYQVQDVNVQLSYNFQSSKKRKAHAVGLDVIYEF